MSNKKTFNYSKFNSIKNFKNLTSLQKNFFHIMRASIDTGGCLLISGDPGIGKTAMIRDMAKVLDYQYIDIRLTQKDEAEVGLFPKLGESKGQDFVKEVPPYWAILSNERPTIVAFEELNRARREIQNAALQILMEREIGHNFKFNDNVYFVATSNMEDSHIEDLSMAMRGRIIHYPYEFNYEYWYKHYAKNNVNSIILEWLSTNKSILTEELKEVKEEDPNLMSYLSPRSISMFSKSLDYIIENEKDVDTILEYSEQMGSKYIGTKIYDLIEFLRKWNNIKIQDVLNNFEKIKNSILKLNREHILYLIEGCKKFISDDLQDNKLSEINKHKNIIKLLTLQDIDNNNIMDQDIIVGFLSFIFENISQDSLFENEENEHIKILKTYKNIFQKELNIINKAKIDQLLY